MFTWLAENYMTVIIIAVVAALIIADIVYLIRQHKRRTDYLLLTLRQIFNKGLKILLIRDVVRLR